MSDAPLAGMTTVAQPDRHQLSTFTGRMQEQPTRIGMVPEYLRKHEGCTCRGSLARQIWQQTARWLARSIVANARP
jgi:hypothetical protein